MRSSLRRPRRWDSTPCLLPERDKSHRFAIRKKYTRCLAEQSVLRNRHRRFDSEKLGFRVRVVHDGTPAYDAGIQAGDFITMVDEQAAEQIPNFVDNLSLYSPGDVVKFKIRRGDEVVALEATLTKLPGWVSKSQGKELARLRSRRSHAIHVWDPTSGELAFPGNHRRVAVLVTQWKISRPHEVARSRTSHSDYGYGRRSCARRAGLGICKFPAGQ